MSNDLELPAFLDRKKNPVEPTPITRHPIPCTGVKTMPKTTKPTATPSKEDTTMSMQTETTTKKVTNRMKSYAPTKAQIAAAKRAVKNGKAAVPASKASPKVKAARKATKQASKAVAKKVTTPVAKKVAASKEAKKLSRGVKVTKVAEGVKGRVRKAAPKAAPAKKAAPSKPGAGGFRAGSIRETIWKLISRAKGATNAELIDATGWASVSASATLEPMAKKMGKKLVSEGRGPDRIFTVK